MHRIDTSTAQVDKFGAGKNGFTGGNPQTGELPTALNEDFFDSIQEEICNVIESAGDVLDKSNRRQLLNAITTLLSNGRLLNIKTFTSSGIYTPTSGTKKIIVEAVGGGGGGGATQSNTSNQRSCASGGGAGGYGKSLYTSGFSSVAITIGQGGAGGTANAASNGAAGGVTSFGSFLICQGGAGGSYASGWALPFVSTSSQSGTVSGANLYYQIATPGTSAYFTANGYLSGSGASSLLGQGGAGAASGRAGYPATGYGSGGGGAVSGDSQTGFAGGSGSNGVVIVWEYA